MKGFEVLRDLAKVKFIYLLYYLLISNLNFLSAQLREIWKTSLAGIICQNSDGVEEVQKYVMQQRNEETNPYIDCEKIKNFNFLPWSESYIKQLFAKVKVSHSQMKVIAKNNKKG